MLVGGPAASRPPAREPGVVRDAGAVAITVEARVGAANLVRRASGASEATFHGEPGDPRCLPVGGRAESVHAEGLRNPLRETLPTGLHSGCEQRDAGDTAHVALRHRRPACLRPRVVPESPGSEHRLRARRRGHVHGTLVVVTLQLRRGTPSTRRPRRSDDHPAAARLVRRLRGGVGARRVHRQRDAAAKVKRLAPGTPGYDLQPGRPARGDSQPVGDVLSSASTTLPDAGASTPDILNGRRGRAVVDGPRRVSCSARHRTRLHRSTAATCASTTTRTYVGSRRTSCHHPASRPHQARDQRRSWRTPVSSSPRLAFLLATIDRLR